MPTAYQQHINSDPGAAPIDTLQTGAVREDQYPYRAYDLQPAQAGQQGTGTGTNELPQWGPAQVIHQKDTKPSATPTWVDTAQWTLFQRATSPNPNLEVHQDRRWQPRGLGVLQEHVLAGQQLLRTWGQVEEQTSSTGAAEYVPGAGAPAQSRCFPTVFRENTSEEPP